MTHYGNSKKPSMMSLQFENSSDFQKTSPISEITLKPKHHIQITME